MTYKRHWPYITLIAVLFSTFFICSAKAECPLESVVDFYAAEEIALADATLRRGVPEEVEKAMNTALWEVYTRMPDSCLELMNNASNGKNRECKGAFYDARNRADADLRKEMRLYFKTQDKQEYAAKVREIFRALLKPLNQICWFYKEEITTTPAPQSETVNCQIFESNYRACKQKSEEALKKCAVWPGPGPCTNRGPLFCTLPSSIHPSCSP